MTATTIVDVRAWEAFDSRGTPTVAARVMVADGSSAVGIAPSGVSTGRFDALEVRDGGDRFAGRGVQRAVTNVDERLAAAVVGLDALEQDQVDARMLEVDGDSRCRNLGANAILAVSLAAALAAASSTRTPLWDLLGVGGPLLPLPTVNILSGGAHAGGLIDIQDVLAVPVGADDLPTALRWAWEVRRGTATVLEELGHPTHLVADEGGLAAPLTSNRAALEVVCRGIERAGLSPGSDVGLAVDVAGNALRVPAGYRLAVEGRTLDVADWIDQLADWIDRFPIVSIEDPLADDDEAGWRAAADQLLPHVQLLGDDLFATDPDRLSAGIEAGIANAILVKPNQNGTLSGAARVTRLARDAGWCPVVSARSGDTEQAWLADVAVGWGAGQIKVGSTHRSERTAKWNRLLELAATTDLPFAGAAPLAADRSRP